MEFLKRQMWLAVTVGAMVVLSVPSLLLWFSNRSEREARAKVYKVSRDKVTKIQEVANKEMVEYLKAAATYRQEQRDEILKSQRKPQVWPLLVKDILPNYPGDTRVYEFKNKYNQKLRDFAQALGGITFKEMAGSLDATATMFINEEAFFKAQWIREPTINQNQQIVIEQLRESQDDLYIQQDIVEAIKRTNDLYFKNNEIPTEQQTVYRAVVKELLQIGIGKAYDRLPDVNSSRPDYPAYQGGRRDRILTSKSGGGFSGFGSGADAVEEVDERYPTMTGHASNNNGGKYKVMPIRIVVIVDAGNYQELLRQLSGTRSFFVIESVRVDIVPELDSAYKNYGMTLGSTVAERLATYGPRPLAQLTLVGESLIFYGTGRPTLPPEPAADQAAKI